MNAWLPVFALAAALGGGATHGPMASPSPCAAGYYPVDIATTIEISGSSESWSSPSDGCRPFAQVVW